MSRDPANKGKMLLDNHRNVAVFDLYNANENQLECGPMPIVMAACRI